ncbi:hypothetical protein [Streptomyces pseudogriseolus]|uniref:hypothetical protein n=1 Tax=Streptomyces pseudogriseolus TaxID=36817 RepID=UPI003FA268D0
MAQTGVDAQGGEPGGGVVVPHQRLQRGVPAGRAVAIRDVEGVPGGLGEEQVVRVPGHAVGSRGQSMSGVPQGLSGSVLGERLVVEGEAAALDLAQHATAQQHGHRPPCAPGAVVRMRPEGAQRIRAVQLRSALAQHRQAQDPYLLREVPPGLVVRRTVAVDRVPDVLDHTSLPVLPEEIGDVDVLVARAGGGVDVEQHAQGQRVADELTERQSPCRCVHERRPHALGERLHRPAAGAAVLLTWARHSLLTAEDAQMRFHGAVEFGARLPRGADVLSAARPRATVVVALHVLLGEQGLDALQVAVLQPARLDRPAGDSDGDPQFAGGPDQDHQPVQSLVGVVVEEQVHGVQQQGDGPGSLPGGRARQPGLEGCQQLLESEIRRAVVSVEQGGRRDGHDRPPGGEEFLAHPPEHTALAGAGLAEHGTALGAAVDELVLEAPDEHFLRPAGDVEVPQVDGGPIGVVEQRDDGLPGADGPPVDRGDLVEGATGLVLLDRDRPVTEARVPRRRAGGPGNGRVGTGRGPADGHRGSPAHLLLLPLRGMEVPEQSLLVRVRRIAGGRVAAHPGPHDSEPLGVPQIALAPVRHGGLAAAEPSGDRPVPGLAPGLGVAVLGRPVRQGPPQPGGVRTGRPVDTVRDRRPVQLASSPRWQRPRVHRFLHHFPRHAALKNSSHPARS